MKFLLTYKGGPGSGHRGHSGRPGKRGGSVAGTGGNNVVPLQIMDNIEVYLSIEGRVFPKSVTDSGGYAVMLMDEKDDLYISTTLETRDVKHGVSHAMLARTVGVDNYDMSLRLNRWPDSRGLEVRTTFGPVIRGTAKDADRHAFRRIVVAARKLRSYGFPDNANLRWYTLHGREVNLSLERWAQ